MRIDVKGSIISNDDKWIYDWFEMESTCPNDIQKTIDKANGETLDVYVDSGGGDIFAGSSIYEALRSYTGQIFIHITGLAASAASVIAMAGKSDIAPTAMIMIHNVSTYAGGDYHDMDKMSETLQQANKAMASAYIEKTGITEVEALAIMDKETWLSAKDAVEKGFVDKISASKNLQLVASYGSPMLPQSVIEKMRNTIKNPLSDNADTDIFMQKQAQAKLKLLNLRRM